MWYACCQCIVPACPEMAISESVLSRHAWRCDNCIVSRSDVSVGTRMTRLPQKRPWWSMTPSMNEPCITGTLAIPDAITGHVIGHAGMGLHQIHDFSHAKVTMSSHVSPLASRAITI